MKNLISVFCGLILGFIAGLIGVGGGEFRIPVLLYLLKLPLLDTINANLLIGILTVLSSIIARYEMMVFNSHIIKIIISMSFGSILGSYIGSIFANKINLKNLKILLTIFLFTIGIKFLLKPFSQSQFSFSFNLTPWQIIIFSSFISFLIGIISGLFGVAGGEFRIPALIYIFGFDIKQAGNISLIISIPTVSAGFLKHNQIKPIEKQNILPVILMGISSIFGSYIGAIFAYKFDKKILEFILGIILISATIRMLTKP